MNIKTYLFYINLTLIITLTFASAFAREGNEGTGGGGSISCGRQHRLLDFYEAEAKYGFKGKVPNLGMGLVYQSAQDRNFLRLALSEILTELKVPFSEKQIEIFVTNKAATVFRKLEADDQLADTFLPTIRRRLIEIFEDYGSRDEVIAIVEKILGPLSQSSPYEIRFVWGVDVPYYATPDLGDSFDLSTLPKGCKLQQAAFNWVYEKEKIIFVFVSAVVEPYLDYDHYKGLLLHEILHTWFKGAKSTEALRETVAYLSAPKEFRAKNREFIRQVILNKTLLPFR